MNFGVKDGIIWLIIFLFKYFSDIFYSKIHFIFPLSKQKKMKNDWRMSLKKMMQTLIAQMIFCLAFSDYFGKKLGKHYHLLVQNSFLLPPLWMRTYDKLSTDVSQKDDANFNCSNELWHNGFFIPNFLSSIL